MWLIYSHFTFHGAEKKAFSTKLENFENTYIFIYINTSFGSIILQYGSTNNEFLNFSHQKELKKGKVYLVANMTV